MATRPKNIILRFIKSFVGRLFLVFILCVVIKAVFFDFFFIPSASMENTLYPGDYVLVNKLSVGSRLPKNLSEVPWLSVFARTENTSSVGFSRNFRLPNFSKIKRGDVMVFNHPQDANEYMVKRCISLPGDTLTIEDTLIRVGNVPISNPKDAKMKYVVVFREGYDYKTFLSKYDITLPDDWYDRKQNSKEVFLSGDQVRQMEADRAILMVQREKTEGLVSAVSNLVIPFKGMKIKIDSINLKRYSHILTTYEAYFSKKYFALNGSVKSDSFTFKNNYYFMMGDNRDQSLDSRQWGLLPEFCIVGKASYVLFSTSKIAKGRFLKAIQ